MKNAAAKKMLTSHDKDGEQNVFEDLGFSHEEANALQIKADLMIAIHKLIKKKNLSQKKLCTILEQPQPRISELLNGKISKTSIEKLLDYLNRLGSMAKLKIV